MQHMLDTTGKRVRVLRQDLDLKQKDLWDRMRLYGVHVGETYISKLERSNGIPSGDIIAALAQSLGTTADYLLLISDDPQPPINQVGEGIVYDITEVAKSLGPVYQAQLLDIGRTLLRTSREEEVWYALRDALIDRIGDEAAEELAHSLASTFASSGPDAMIVEYENALRRWRRILDERDGKVD